MAGHIEKRGKLSWSVVIDLGRNPETGRRRQLWRSVKGTRREAETLLVRLLHERDSGIEPLPERLSVADYLRRWLEGYARPAVAPKTLRSYEQIIRLHLVPRLGAIRLSQLRPLHIETAYSGIRAAGLAPRTVLYCHRVLSQALERAVRWQLLARNPARAVEAPRFPRTEVRALDADGVRRVLDVAERTPLGALVHVAVMTGLRQGELLGLCWSDVDLERGVAHVRQVCQWLSGIGFFFREPKTHRSARPVALTPSTVARFHRHRRAQLESRLALGSAYRDGGLVFTTGIGTPIEPSNLRRVWLRIVAAAGVGPLRFHDLRHSHASLLLREGIHPKVVSERLGHATVGITLDTYSHVLPGLQAQAATVLDRVLAERPESPLANG